MVSFSVSSVTEGFSVRLGIRSSVGSLAMLTISGTTPEYRTENGWTAVPAAGLDVSSFYGKELAVREQYDIQRNRGILCPVGNPQFSRLTGKLILGRDLPNEDGLSGQAGNIHIRVALGPGLAAPAGTPPPPLTLTVWRSC